MEDGKQLIRWAIPGFATVVIGILTIVLADGRTFLDYETSILHAVISQVDGSASAGSINTIGGIVGVMGIVTVIGFFAATLHHLLLNRVYPSWFCPDLRRAIECSELHIRDYTDEKIDTRCLTPRGAWVVVNIALHANQGSDDSRVKAAEWRTRTMYDLTHGAGATLSGAMVALLVTTLIASVHKDICLPQVLSGGFAAVIATAMNYRALAKSAEEITGGMLLAVQQEFTSRWVTIDARQTLSIPAQAHRKGRSSIAVWIWPWVKPSAAQKSAPDDA